MKVLFVCYGLGIGGIEKCLVNLVNAMSEDEYDIDILLMNPEYALKDQIKRKVHFIDLFQYVMNTTDTLQEIQSRGGIAKHIAWFLRYCVFRIVNKFGEKPWLLFKPLKKDYDIAIAYSHHDWSKNYVIDKVNADKKYVFYHDGIYKLNIRRKKIDAHYLGLFDNVVAVSKCTAKMLSNEFPNLKNSIIVKYNLINKKILNVMAEEDIKEILNIQPYIASVGRLEEQKQPMIAVELCKKLLDNGVDIIWVWVGDGSLNPSIKKKIEEYGISDKFILTGNRSNPYPYMKNCMIYVQPSHDEAFCTTTNEARLLGKVIITTDCSGMDEQILNGKTGFIVKNDVDLLYEKIIWLINNPNELKNMEERVISYNVDLPSFTSEYKDLF